MSRVDHIGRCLECDREFRYGDCFKQYCFDHDPAQAQTRQMLAVKRQPGEQQDAWMKRVREAGGLK